MANLICLWDDLNRSNPAEPLQEELQDEKVITTWFYYNKQFRQLQFEIIWIVMRFSCISFVKYTFGGC